MPYKDRDKQRRYMNEWIKQRRLDWVEANGPCAKCGSDDDLQLDYIGEGKANHHIWSFCEAKRAMALRNYRVLCRRCREAQYQLPQEKRRAIAHRICSGVPLRQIQEETGHDRSSALRRIRLELARSGVHCGCGLGIGHPSRCWWTVQNNPRIAATFAAKSEMAWRRRFLSPAILNFPAYSTLTMEEATRAAEMRCEVRGCAFPKHHNENTCRYHIEFFAFPISTTFRNLDIRDLFPDDDRQASALRIATEWEMEHYERLLG